MKDHQVIRDERRWQDWGNALLGGWLILAPFVGIGVVNDVAAWSSYVTGTVVAIIAIAAIIHPKMWEEWVNLVVGFWLIIAPFLLGFTVQQGPTWNHFIVGLLISIDALWVMMQLPSQHKHA